MMNPYKNTKLTSQLTSRYNEQLRTNINHNEQAIPEQPGIKKPRHECNGVWYLKGCFLAMLHTVKSGGEFLPRRSSYLDS